MKRYSFTAEADVPIEFDHPGRFFTLLNCITPIDVSLQRGGAQPEVLEAVTPGIWADFGEQPFTRIRIVSHVAQSVSFLVSMIRAGWTQPPPSAQSISVPLNGLAASAAVSTDTVDLGENWPDTVMSMQCDQLVAGAGGSMYLNCSEFSNMVNSRLAVGQGYNGVAYTTVTTTNHHSSSLRPTARYVRLGFTNGASPQSGNARLMLHIMKNVTA